MNSVQIVWFRRDLRTSDHQALSAASEAGQPVLPVYIENQSPGGAARWWLHHSLQALDDELQTSGSRLLLLSGPPETILPELAARTNASDIWFTKAYSAAAIAEEQTLEAALSDAVTLHGIHDYYLSEPGQLRSGAGKPYKVFTPFWKAGVALGEPARPIAAPQQLRSLSASRLEDLSATMPVVALGDLKLLPVQPDWAGGLRASWQPGTASAHTRLDSVAEDIGRYAELRDRPDTDGTSRLSPHLHFGELSPRQVWHAINDASMQARKQDGADAFLRQLWWRDFSGHLLFSFPDLPRAPLRPGYEHFPWVEDDEALSAWQQGKTGYPLVDAGMRQLWTTGWMHNRVRMVVASFLVKNLLIRWQDGANWFLDTLVDADLANNSAGWQWVAGCGTDAAPYFRIYNPVLQSKKFDPKAEYIRRWIPEIAALPNEVIHEPWQADGLTQELHGVVMGKDYPFPIVDLTESRDRALAAYNDLRCLLQSPAASPGSSVG